jgi:hypothetical protein
MYYFQREKKLEKKSKRSNVIHEEPQNNSKPKLFNLCYDMYFNIFYPTVAKSDLK